MQFKNLSAQDALALLDIIHTGLSCSSEKDIRKLLDRLSDLLPYQASLACLGRFNDDQTVESFKVINIDYPEDYLKELMHRGLVEKDPVVQENFRSYRIQYWQDTFDLQEWSAETYEIISLAEDFGFSKVSEGRGYAHGVRNQKGTEGSFFCYHGLERCPRTEEILTVAIPHLHAALTRLSPEVPNIFSPLTSKETEVLRWVKEGKSSWEISVILAVSERTVKFHIANIMGKLDASTRTHAVAIALEKGLITVD